MPFLFSAPSLPALGSSAKIYLLGIFAGASVYLVDDWDSFLLSNEPGGGGGVGGAGGGKPPVRPDAVQGSGNGGSGSGDDHERYLILLKVLLELCQGGDDEEAWSNFLTLKQMMQREWFELHKKREELKTKKVEVEADKERVCAEREEKVSRRLKKVEEVLSEIAKGEQKLDQDRLRMGLEAVELKDGQADLAKQQLKAKEMQKHLDAKLYRVGLDAKTVFEIRKDAKMAGAGPDSSTGKEGGNAGQDKGGDKGASGKKDDEPAGFWKKLVFALNVPVKTHGLYTFACDTSYYVVFGVQLAALLPNLDQSKIEALIEFHRTKHQENLVKIEEKLVEMGLKKKASDKD